MPIASSLHATPVLDTRHCALSASTICTAFAVVCQSESSIVSADAAVPAAESDQWLVFEVTDTGCGISQRGLASLFTEYVQVSVVCKLLMVQWCFPSCCAQRTASALMPAFALFCSIACACVSLVSAAVSYSLAFQHWYQHSLAVSAAVSHYVVFQHWYQHRPVLHLHLSCRLHV